MSLLNGTKFVPFKGCLDGFRKIIVEKTEGSKVVAKIQSSIDSKEIPKSEQAELFKIIESEIMSLHEGNVARFKVRPSEFQSWKSIQGKK